MAISDSIREWADDWASKFSQDFTEERLRSIVGKRVMALGPEPTQEEINEGAKQKGFRDKVIIGFSIDTIPTDEADVHRFSVITQDGLQVALVTNMVVEELPEE